VVLNALFLKGAFASGAATRPMAEADGFAAEKRLFRFSLSYLFLHFGAIARRCALRRRVWEADPMPITQPTNCTRAASDAISAWRCASWPSSPSSSA
jgi:hypothetical protein